jgi:hypothetical protein
MAEKKVSLPGLMGGVPKKTTTIDPKFGQGPKPKNPKPSKDLEPTQPIMPIVSDTQKVVDEIAADRAARQRETEMAAAERRADAQASRQSAYDLLYQQFNQYGLGSLVEGIKSLITSNTSPDEFTLKLRELPAYQERFAANKSRIAKGLGALSEAEYIGLEDQYQNIMRQYGLPASYYAETVTPSGVKKQAGFEQFLTNDISPMELEDRIMTAQDRVLKANPEVTKALKEFYPDINNGDILAYSLDPQNAIKNIQRKVTAAEIGGAAMAQGLATGAARAEELAGYGVDKARAQQGFQSVAAIAPRGGQLASIYGQEPYGQLQAEQEVFDLGGASEARKRREKLSALEQASFSASTGAAQSALGRERAMGQGQF